MAPGDIYVNVADEQKLGHSLFFNVSDSAKRIRKIVRNVGGVSKLLYSSKGFYIVRGPDTANQRGLYRFFLPTISPERVTTGANPGEYLGLMTKGSELYTLVWSQSNYSGHPRALDPATGLISVPSGWPSSLTGARDLAWDGSDAWTITQNNPGFFLEYERSLWKVYPQNTQVGSTRYSDIGDSTLYWRGIEWDGSDLYAFEGRFGTFYRINRSTGFFTRIGNAGAMGAGFNFWGLTWDGENLYTVNSSTNSLYTVSRTTGQTTLVGAVGALGGGEWRGIAAI